MKESFLKPEKNIIYDPVSYYNEFKQDHFIGYYNQKTKGAYINDDGRAMDGNNIVLEIKSGIIVTKETPELPKNSKLTLFQALNYMKFKGNYNACINYIYIAIMKNEIPYIRVGCDYFKLIKKPDRMGIEREIVKPWKKDELKTDHDKDIFTQIPKYDDFTMVPNNKNYQSIIHTKNGVFYNLYSKFSHKQDKTGDFPWIRKMMAHVFGTTPQESELGYRYMKLLYEYPERPLPILVLMSRERATGKSTFTDFLNILFGENMVNINPEDLLGSHNAIYAHANIICIEETMIDKAASVEKLKAITTAKFMTVNPKFVNQYKIPFFGKIIINTNNVRDFARIDENETRFWIRYINPIDKGNENHNILQDMTNEIPAFLYYLSTLEQPDLNKDRLCFTPDEIRTENLDNVKSESRTGLYKELFINFTDYFNKEEKSNTLSFTLTDIKERWFLHDGKISKSYIRKCMLDEFKVPLEVNVRKQSFNQGIPVPGNFYTVLREWFTDIKTEDISDNKKDPDIPF